MLIAQLSDTHILEDGQLLSEWVDAYERTERAINWLNHFLPRPDVAIISGDLVHNGTPEEYKRCRELIDKLKMPVYVIPGNHDDRDAMRTAFSDHKYIDQKSEFIHYVIDDYPVRLIGLDTLVPGEMRGELCEKRLEWLSKQLKKDTKKPTVIFMHHPPFKSGIAVMDTLNCANGDKMAEILEQHDNILRVLCGHVHRHTTVDWAGTLGIISPSTTIQLELDFNMNDPKIIIPWSAHETGGIMLHSWNSDTNMSSHIQQISA